MNTALRLILWTWVEACGEVALDNSDEVHVLGSAGVALVVGPQEV